MTQRIYTRTGDAGETGLFGGGRVSKAAARVDAYGEVDELNATLGWALALEPAAMIGDVLRTTQSDLFTIGAHLATPAGSRSSPHVPALPERRIGEFERWIDAAESELPALDAFILPGGTPVAAALHMARTVCRRAERRVVALAAEEPIEAAILVYLNRLSDLLFVAARLEHRRSGGEDLRWEPRAG
jgi:cob(I)alamin adenosyltransferase